MKDTSTWRSLEITATQTNRPRANPPSTRVTGESCNRITNFKEISRFLIGVFRVFKLLAQKKVTSDRVNFYFQSALWILRKRRSRSCGAASSHARVLRQIAAASPVERQSLIFLYCPEPSAAQQLDAEKIVPENPI